MRRCGRRVAPWKTHMGRVHVVLAAEPKREHTPMHPTDSHTLWNVLRLPQHSTREPWTHFRRIRSPAAPICMNG